MDDKMVLEDAGDAIFVADVSGSIVLWNDAAEELFGYSRESMLGGSISQLIPERYLRDYEKSVAAASEAEKPANSHITVVVRAADGTEYPVEAAVSIVSTGDGAVAVGVVRKIDDFKMLALLQESERHLREAERVAGMGSFEWSVGSDEIEWSDQLARIYGYEPGSHPKRLAGFLDCVHPDDRENLQNNIRNALTTGSGWSMDERILHANTGEERVLSSRVTVMRDAHGRIARLCGICHDVTEQRRAEEALAASDARFRNVFDNAPIGMLLVEVGQGDALVTRANKALSCLVGYSNAELSRMPLSQIVDSADWSAMSATLEGALVETGTPSHIEIRLLAANGSSPVVISAASRIGDGVSSSRLILHLEDVTLRKRVEEQLRHRVLHDALTGLGNRDLLLDRLNGALARAARAQKSVGVLLLNIDNFKIINDTKGHTTGDKILRTLASRLTNAARSGETSARVGGDEFVMVCENVSRDEEMLSLARRVAAALAEPIWIGGGEFIATVSIGVATGRGRDQPEQLLRDADLAMYHAKQRGKNTIEVFNESLRRRAIDRVEVERDLRRALRSGEIEPYYQPIVALDSGAIAGFEALARWHHPQRGILLPAQFLPVAEETHLIGALGTTMLEKACAQLAAWQERSPNLTMAVNLSPLQLDAEFSNAVERTIARYSIAPRSLLAEITESVFLDMQKAATIHLNALAGLGVQLGIDDFGMGYSSLLYLKRFPVQFLKIDRSFVNELPGNQEDLAIVKAIASLGRSLEIVTIAEGVETAEQLDLLRSLGCTYAQGHFISRPKPASECVLTP